MAEINLPELVIPDNKIITSSMDLGMDLTTHNLPFYPFTFFGDNPENLNIKHVEDRYKFIGNVPLVGPCPNTCSPGQYLDCNTNECKDYRSYTITPIVSSGGVITETTDHGTTTYYQESWHEWDWGYSMNIMPAQPITKTTLAELETYTEYPEYENGEIVNYVGQGFENGIAKYTYRVMPNKERIMANDFLRDTFQIDVPVGQYTYPNTWEDREQTYSTQFVLEVTYTVNCNIVGNK